MCEALLYEINGHRGKANVTLVWAVGVDMIATPQERPRPRRVVRLALRKVSLRSELASKV